MEEALGNEPWVRAEVTAITPRLARSQLFGEALSGESVEHSPNGYTSPCGLILVM